MNYLSGKISMPQVDPYDGSNATPGGGNTTNNPYADHNSPEYQQFLKDEADKEAAMLAAHNSQPDTIFANLIREQYDDFQTYGKPLEQLAADNLLNPENVDKLRGAALGYADTATDNAFDSAERRQSTYLSRFGQTMTPQDKALQDNRTAVKKSSTRVDARNQVRGATRDREISLLGG